MNQGMQDDFKRDGLVSQLVRRIGDLEAFEREFRLKQFGSGGGNFTLIDDQVLAADSASVTFAAIPGTYKHLMFEVSVRASHVGAADFLVGRFNGDAGNNYYSLSAAIRHSASLTTVERVGTSSGLIAIATGTTAGAGDVASQSITIPDYASTTFNKGWVTPAAYTSPRSAGNISIRYIGGEWISNAAITDIVFTMDGGSNILAGSRFTLYGLS